MKTMNLFLTVAWLGTGLTACNNAGQRAESDTINVAQGVNDSTAMVNQDDAEFAVKAADAGLAEIQLAKLAMEKASDERLKELAANIVEEHEQIHEELEELADKHNITLPPVPNADQVDNQRKLMEMSDSEFDRRYILMIADEHDDVVSLYEDAADDAQHPDVRAFAASTLPILARHQERVEALRDAMVPQAGMETAPIIQP